MADMQGTTVIHGNHGFFLFDGNIVGRAKNINMSIEGSLDEFYEVGSAWLADHEVIQRKVNVSIERGAIDFSLLAYAVGVKASQSLTGSSAGTFNFAGTGTTATWDLIADDAAGNVLTMAADTQIMTAPFLLDVSITATKITSTSGVTQYVVTARDCKIIRHGISAPNSAYWTVNMDLVGKQIGLSNVPLIS